MVLLASSSLARQPGVSTPAELNGVDIVERLGEEAALDATLMNDAGQMVRFGDYFNDGPLARTADGRGKPAILALVYYDCPVVCVVTMERLRRAMNKIEYLVGEDFNVLVVSIDHTNTTDMALKEKLASLMSYNRPETDALRAGWVYHTASAGNSQRLADSVGFKFNFIAEAGEYAHAPAIMVLTPEGRVARYFYGVNYDDRASELQLALVEASKGNISATLGDRLILFCFHYDPTKGSYTLQARRVMQISGVVTMLGIAGLVIVLRGQEKRRARRRASAAGRAIPPTTEAGSSGESLPGLGDAGREVALGGEPSISLGSRPSAPAASLSRPAFSKPNLRSTSRPAPAP